MRNLAMVLGVLFGAVALGACGDDGNNGTPDAGHPDAHPDTPIDTAGPTCGDGHVDTGEQCDDGNTTGGDGCSATCQNEVCGNGTVDVGEQCDDGNTTNGDGCEANCTNPRCGNSIIDSGETCDDGNTTNGDGCDSTCHTETLCGNGNLDAGEECDDGNMTDGDGCDSNCTLPACGNGIVDTGEACDDGNVLSGDGCSSACVMEPNETEPNEDGTPSTGGSFTSGNDIDATAVANANANGAFLASHGEVHVLAHIDPEGDEDLFAITNDTAAVSDVRLDTWNLATDQSWGMPCADIDDGGPDDAIDTVMRVWDATPTSQDYNDDRDGGTDRCSGLDVTVPAGATIYVSVILYGDSYGATVTPPAPHYGLQVRFTPIVCGDGLLAAGEECDDGNNVNGDGCEADCTLPFCGNGVLDMGETCDDGNTTNGDGCDSNCTLPVCGNHIVDPGEVCDDGNTTNGDGCSSTCQLEVAVTPEVEPNDTTAQADTSSVQIAGTTYISGAINVADDVDTFRVTVATGSVVAFQTLTDLGGQGCTDFLDVALLDSTGATMTDNDEAGVGDCGGITTWLVPGTYYIQVTGDTGAAYYLDTDFYASVGAESEAAATMGVNDTTATASTNFGTTANSFVYGDHELIADLDYYAITVPAGAGVRAEVVEGDWTDESCDSEGIDSRIYLYDSTGAQIAAEDDGGRGYCSYLNAIGTDAEDTGAINTTGTTQTWYVEVRGYNTSGTNAQSLFKYHLAVLIK